MKAISELTSAQLEREQLRRALVKTKDAILRSQSTTASLLGKFSRQVAELERQDRHSNRFPTDH